MGQNVNGAQIPFRKIRMCFVATDRPGSLIGLDSQLKSGVSQIYVIQRGKKRRRYEWNEALMP